jgi:WD40 repeat protein
MTTRSLPLAALLLAVLGPASPRSPAADPPDEPLPDGAKARLGTARMAFRGATGAVLLPPDYATFIVPHPKGFRRYDAATGRPLDKDSTDRAGPGGSVVVSADGKRAVALRTGSLTVREVATGAAFQDFLPPPGFVTLTTGAAAPNLSLSGDGKVLAQGGMVKQKGTVIIWDVGASTEITRIQPTRTGPPTPVLSPDGKAVAVWSVPVGGGIPAGGPDAIRTLGVYDATTGKERYQIKVTGSRPVAVAFSPDGSLVAASAGEGSIDVCDAATGKPKFALLGRTGQGQRLAFSSDGKALAAVAADGAIQTWAVADGKPLTTTECPAAIEPVAPHGVGFAAADRVVAWGVAGSSAAAAWEAPSGKLLTPLGEHTSAVKSIAFGNGGKEVITSGLDSRVVRWDPTTGKRLGTLTVRPGRSGPPSGARQQPILTLAPDGKRAFANLNPAALFDLETGRELLAVPGGAGAGPAHHVPSADLTRVATLTFPDQKQSTLCVVWDTVTQRKVAELEHAPQVGGMPAAGFSPDGKRLVTTITVREAGKPRAALRITGWDLTTGKKLGEVDAVEAFTTTHIAVVDDTTAAVLAGNVLVSVDYAAGKKGEPVQKPRPKAGTLTGPLAISPDGKRLAAGVTTDDGNPGVRVYEWPTGKEVHTFTGHTGSISALAFSPDGKVLATGSQDTTILLWDLTK